MSSVIAILISLVGAGLEGPIDQLYGYAEQQEAYLSQLGSYTAEIRQVREVFKISAVPGESVTSVNTELLSEKTIIGGGRFVERRTELRTYAASGTQLTKHTFAYVLQEDQIAEVARDEETPRVKIQKFVEGKDLPKEGQQMKNLMTPRDILVHGFGDGRRTLRQVCEDLARMAKEQDMAIEKTVNDGGLEQYTLTRNGEIFESLQIDPSRMGMITGTQLYEAGSNNSPRLEVRVILGNLPDGRPFPAVWNHLTYSGADDKIAPGRLILSTRNELLDIKVSSVEASDVTLLAFGLPEDTTAVVRYGDANELFTGRLQGTVVIENE